MSTTHIVTGATGLVGSALLLELGRADPGARFLCPARGTGPDARHRLESALTRCAESFHLTRDALADVLDRTVAVPGIDFAADVDATGLALPSGPALPSGRVEFWHSAAAMLFQESERRTDFATNTAGTRRALALAERLGASSFTYVSTAYAAGAVPGTLHERAFEHPLPRNPYERSKVAAERIVLGAAERLTVRILRPSVVCGHSRTLEYAGRLSGAYTIQRLVAAFHRAVRSSGDGPYRVLALPDEPFDLVPVDHVVRDAVRICADPGASGVFHLTNPAAPSTGDCLRACFANAGGREPLFTSDPAQLSASERLLHDMLGVYTPYLNNPQRFDRSRADAAGGPSRWPAGPETLRALLAPYARPSARTGAVELPSPASGIRRTTPV